MVHTAAVAHIEDAAARIAGVAVDTVVAPAHIAVVRIGAGVCVVAGAVGIVGIAAAVYKAGCNQADIVVQPLLVPALARVDEFPALGQAALSLVAEVYIEVAALLAVVSFEHTECSAPEFQDAVARPAGRGTEAGVRYILQYDVQRELTSSPWMASGCPTKANGTERIHAGCQYVDSIGARTLGN